MNNIETKSFRIKDYLLKNKLSVETSLYTIILNISDICNRQCSFCPRSKGYQPPKNHPKFMSLDIIENLIEQVKNKFMGNFSLSGFGEPLLHPDIQTIITKLNAVGETVLTTNGVNPDLLLKLTPSKIDISIYDEETDKLYSKLLPKFNVPTTLKKQYVPGNTFFNNRAGNAGPVQNIPNTCCYIPFMKTTIDTNGDVLLCCSDWKRIHVIGNIMNESIWNIWKNATKEDRLKLLSEKRYKCKLCSRCDSPGDLYGIEFKNFWENYYGEHQSNDR